ncbi:odorant receptor 13a-like isoform X1 [Athalia rosae]|uniref:odorant receptor 13a-like isoform X1 n=1 Tax=Athalia rosae TaxID=37344 RepID=UPI00203378FE|nr:odorant receptor 13a-like isoform X1 [Athalia rosae]XP_048513678.1 odorant receptor 13a-like isoform X1 [Athalia rosae]
MVVEKIESKERSSGRDDFGQYIDHTARILRCLRMMEMEEDASILRRTAIVTTTAIMLFLNAALGISEMMKLRNTTELSALAMTVGASWMHFIGFAKWAFFVWKIKDVSRLFLHLEECYNMSLSISDIVEGHSQLRKDMNRARKNSLRFTWVWGFFVNWGVVHWCLNPFLVKWTLSRSNVSMPMNEDALPYSTWIPWDTSGTGAYVVTYLLECVGSQAAIIGSTAYDTFYITIMLMITAQLRYLNYFLANTGDGDPANVRTETTNKLTYPFLLEKLKRGKDHHNAILTFLTLFGHVTSPAMFAQCIGSTAVICLIVFEVSTVKGTDGIIKIWSMVEYVAGNLLQIFFFCYFANKITELGLEVADSTYRCGWENMVFAKSVDQKTREKGLKSVGFLIRDMSVRAQKPIRLSGGPFYVLSLETFLAMLGAAFSYLTVLRELNSDE